VCVLIYGMHCPAVYRDPDAFKPERFLPEQSAGRHPFTFIPFSAGLRNGIAQKYGLFELKVVLSTLIRRFRFSMDEATKVRTVASSEIVQSQWLNYGQQI
jgi:cytochrome P450 family 4